MIHNLVFENKKITNIRVAYNLYIKTFNDQA